MAAEQRLRRKIAVIGFRGVGTCAQCVGWSLTGSAAFRSRKLHKMRNTCHDVPPLSAHVNAGKSAMTTVFVERRFPDNYEPTIEQTMVTIVRFPEADVEFETEIIDTAGQVSPTELATCTRPPPPCALVPDCPGK